jgi:hypothetical protein
MQSAKMEPPSFLLDLFLWLLFWDQKQERTTRGEKASGRFILRTPKSQNH